MANYFDEHDCIPLGDHEEPNHHLLMARLLIDSGIAVALNLNYDSRTGRLRDPNLAPPTSKQWLKTEFPKCCFSESKKAGHQCPICLKEFKKSNVNDENSKSAVKVSECEHIFHSECLRKWLELTSNCPMCRKELPTDDEQYEELKKQKRREKTRQQQLADLHNSMYG